MLRNLRSVDINHVVKLRKCSPANTGSPSLQFQASERFRSFTPRLV